MNELKVSLAFFWHYLKKFKIQLVVVLISIVISTYLSIKSPDFVGRAMEELGVFLQKFYQTGEEDKTAFMKIIQLMLLFAAGSAVSQFIQSIIMVGVSGKSTNKMRINLFEKLERLSISFFDKTSDGEILLRFTSDLDNIGTTLNQAIHQIMSNVAMLIAVVAMMFSSNARLAWVTVSLVPFAMLAMVLIIMKAQKYVDLQQDTLGELNGFADERFSSQKLIIANGLRDEAKKDFVDYNEKVYQTTFKGQLYSNLLMPVMQGFGALSNALVVFYTGWLIISGKIEVMHGIGLVVSFSMYSSLFYRPLGQLASQYSMIQLAMTGARRIEEIFVEKDEVDFPNAKPIDGISGTVKLEHVDFEYDLGKPILKDISIDVEKGQMVALVGHTGSGKTTIMNLLNRFYEVTKGAIYFDGVDIRDITMKSLRQHVGIVLQDSVIFSGTVHENIAFGNQKASREEVIHVAKLANIHDFIESLDDGYDTIVSDANNSFSVGQKQLMSIARTLITNPDLLILDEATSNVDTVTESHIQGAMDAIIAGRTSFVIAHRLKTILNADKIIVLSQGEIIEEGTHESLLEQKGHYAELYENQFVFE